MIQVTPVGSGKPTDSGNYTHCDTSLTFTWQRPFHHSPPYLNHGVAELRGRHGDVHVCGTQRLYLLLRAALAARDDGTRVSHTPSRGCRQPRDKRHHWLCVRTLKLYKFFQTCIYFKYIVPKSCLHLKEDIIYRNVHDCWHYPNIRFCVKTIFMKIYIISHQTSWTKPELQTTQTTKMWWVTLLLLRRYSAAFSSACPPISPINTIPATYAQSNVQTVLQYLCTDIF